MKRRTIVKKTQAVFTMVCIHKAKNGMLLRHGVDHCEKKVCVPLDFSQWSGWPPRYRPFIEPFPAPVSERKYTIIARRAAFLCRLLCKSVTPPLHRNAIAAHKRFSLPSLREELQNPLAGAFAGSSQAPTPRKSWRFGSLPGPFRPADLNSNRNEFSCGRARLLFIQAVQVGFGMLQARLEARDVGMGGCESLPDFPRLDQ
jgi:hypothetical protein